MELMVKNQEIIGNRTGVLGDLRANIFTNSLSYNTQRAYVRDIMDFFDVEAIKDITIDKILDVNVASANMFRQILMDKGYATSTINRKITALSKFYSYLSRREINIIDYNPFSTKEGMLRLKENKQYSNTRCLTEDEVKKLVKVTLDGNDILSSRNRVIILLLATTGMRRSEIVNIKIGMVRTTMGRTIVELTKTKGDKPRIVVISEAVKPFIDKYIEMRGLSYSDKDKYLLANHTSNAGYYGEGSICDHTVYHVVKNIAQKSGVDENDITPHCLRHTWVTEALTMGLPIQDVADMVGHSDVSTTRRYDHTNRVISHNPADALANKFLD